MMNRRLSTVLTVVLSVLVIGLTGAVTYLVVTVISQQHQINEQRVTSGSQRCDLTRLLGKVAMQGDPQYVLEFRKMTADCEALVRKYREQAGR